MDPGAHRRLSIEYLRFLGEHKARLDKLGMALFDASLTMEEMDVLGERVSRDVRTLKQLMRQLEESGKGIRTGGGEA